MPKHGYINVDESGDAAFKLDPVTGELLSSSYYVAAALHLCDDAFRGMNGGRGSLQVLFGTE